MKEKFFHQLLSMFGVTPEYPETLIPSVEDTARILKINPEIYKRFENAYQTSDAIGIPGYSVNAKQAAREKEGVDTSAPDLSSLMNRIVRELENDTFIWQYTDGTVSPFSINMPEIPEPVTVEELNMVPREYRPQLAGNVVCRGWNDHAGRQAAYWYNLAVTEKSEKKREELYEIITKEAISYGVGIIDQKEIDRINILNATKEGLTMAVKELNPRPDLIIVDALTKIDTDGIPYQSIIKGDAKCYSISAASIIAKVTRDRLMVEYDSLYPGYGFAKNMGYGTAEHIDALKKIGPCAIHRRTFIKNFV